MNKKLLLLFLHFPVVFTLCYYGTTNSNPGSSCRDILLVNPGCYSISGYYWIQCGNMSSAIQVYCEMTTLQGGWLRVASENFTDNSTCPCEWVNVTVDGTRYCTVANTDSQASWNIDHMCPFSEVRGYVLVDQRGKPDGFYGLSGGLNGSYVDGISFTFGKTSRQHLFTYVVADEVTHDSNRACECQGSSFTNYPRFVLWDFMCDTGYFSSPYVTTSVAPRTLFTGEGCEEGSGCCHVAGAPWFYKGLSQTVSEDLEVRILADEDHSVEMILVRELELYVR